MNLDLMNLDLDLNLAQIAILTKNTVDNLADITKLKGIDTNSFVTRTKFSADTNALDDKIDGVEKKPQI